MSASQNDYSLTQNEQKASSTKSASSVARDVFDIAKMRTETISDAIVVIRDTITCSKDEVLEECLQFYNHTVQALHDAHKFAIEKICYFPTYMIRKYSENIKNLLIFDPVSTDFNFAALSVGYFWAVVTMMAKCAGEVFASSCIGYSLLSFIFSKTFLFTFFIYIAIPAYAVTMNMKTPNALLTTADRRLLILVLAFTIGAGTHYLLVNWEQPQFAPPPFYSPLIVALLFEFICPQFTQDRRLFLLSSVGISGCICFAYGIANDIFDFTYFYTSIWAIAMSFYNMQLMLADPAHGWGDSIEGLVLLPINSMYNQLVTTILFGNYIPNRDHRDAIPDSIEEQYSLLLAPKK